MENKKFYEAFIAHVKNELSDYAQKQKELKKSRKLQQNLPIKEIWDIEEKLSCNKQTITEILFYYRWLKHSKKYWANRGVHSFKDYICQGLFNDDPDKIDAWWNSKHWHGSDETNEKREIRIIKGFVSGEIVDAEIECPDNAEWYEEAFLKIN